MVKFQAPRSDKGRAGFMRQAVAMAQGSVESEVPPEVVAAMVAWLERANAAESDATDGLAGRARAVRLAQEATTELALYVQDFLVGLRRRVRRLRLPEGVLNFYGLTTEGKLRHEGKARDDWLTRAGLLLAGEETAVTAGYPPMCNPSAAELAAKLTIAQEAAAAVDRADRIYDEAQAALAQLRPQADELIKEVVAQIRFATRRLDAPSQRRVLRRYGARFITRGKAEPGELEADEDEG